MRIGKHKIFKEEAKEEEEQKSLKRNDQRSRKNTGKGEKKITSTC